MQAANTNRQVITQSHAPGRATFGISRTNEAHIMTILRDTLYSDKILAVLREYGANAWDAHRQSNKGTLPIQVTLPTPFNPTLAIRDFGLGMSEDDVFNVYTQYGASTKRDTNDAVGMLGIGCKSAFCYSDTFTITSWHGGAKRVYVAVLDESDVGEIQKLHEEPCDPAEVGIEILVPVKPKDIEEFKDKSRTLFKYFDPQPVINLALDPVGSTPDPDSDNQHGSVPRPVALPQIKRHVTPYGFISESEYQWMAIMGCVPYRLDIRQVEKELIEAGIWDSVQRLKGAVFFEIGDVQISASREDLKYSDFTKKAIATRVVQLVEAYVADVMDTLAAKDGATDWEKRIKARFMVSTLKVPLPKRYADWGREHVPLWTDGVQPKTFTLQEDGHSAYKIPVTDYTKVYIKDDLRSIKGYDLRNNHVIVAPVDGADLAAVRIELDSFLASAQLLGVPVARLSTHPWYPPRVNGRRRGSINPKHQARMFRLKEDEYFRTPYSDAWGIESREPTPEDVFVILSEFKVNGAHTFYSTYTKDVRVATLLGAKMPPVYGYKTTEKKPVAISDCQGTVYSEWRKTFFAGLMTDDMKVLLEARHWVQAFDHEHYNMHDKAPVIRDAMKEALGADHPVTEMLCHLVDASNTVHKAGSKMQEVLDHLIKVVGEDVTPIPALRLQTFYLTYPLIKIVGEGLNSLTNRNRDAWVNYMKLVDRDLNRASESDDSGSTTETLPLPRVVCG